MISDIIEIEDIKFLLGCKKGINKYCVVFDGNWETASKIAAEAEKNIISILSNLVIEICIDKEKVSEIEKIPGVGAVLCVGEYSLDKDIVLGNLRQADSNKLAEIIDYIRKYHQIDIYTVNESWCIQLFDLNDCPNDSASCIFEIDNTDLAEALRECASWVFERISGI